MVSLDMGRKGYREDREYKRKRFQAQEQQEQYGIQGMLMVNGQEEQEGWSIRRKGSGYLNLNTLELL